MGFVFIFYFLTISIAMEPSPSIYLPVFKLSENDPEYTKPNPEPPAFKNGTFTVGSGLRTIMSGSPITFKGSIRISLSDREIMLQERVKILEKILVSSKILKRLRKIEEILEHHDFY
jgi:hypothetical protein